MSERRQAALWVSILSIIIALIVWHVIDWHSRGMYLEMFQWFLTGEGYIRGVTKSDVKVLREYCLSGGMLFAAAGSSRFDRYFRRFIAGGFPDKRLVDIPDDDPIFQMPYVFPHGSPPLWHHGGRKARGIKHRGRWCVFYHPGDLNDAWKTGHSGLRPELARASYQMGVNVVYYAITNYLAMTRRERK
ncbi:hypothetical protein LCGC14_3072810 [marine sediment metagenome]|uniref:DUF4159 domain-containing protein n=1 Tax=marine sediment metagenome TaxID=412755 RepID=A0A0F8Z681_9ZZZZ